MRLKRKASLLSPVFALIAVLVLVVPASAGRAWCRADPVLIVDGEVVDIQVSSNLKMYREASGPIDMIVTVRPGSSANVILQDFGFGHGYNIRIKESKQLKKGVLARVEMRAPASQEGLPVGVHGTRTSVKLSGLLSGDLDVLWLDDAYGSSNEWITLDVK